MPIDAPIPESRQACGLQLSGDRQKSADPVGICPSDGGCDPEHNISGKPRNAAKQVWVLHLCLGPYQRLTETTTLSSCTFLQFFDKWTHLQCMD